MIILLIVALFTGAIFGNMATTLLYRMPRGIKIFNLDRDSVIYPVCSSCHTNLRWYEFFPIVGWIVTGGACRHCGARVPVVYLLIEISIVIISCILCYLYGLSEIYLLFLAFITNLLLNCILYYQHGYITYILTLSLSIIGVIFHIVDGGSLLDTVIVVNIVVILLVWMNGMRFLNYRNDDKAVIHHIMIPAAVWSYDLLYMVQYLFYFVVIYCIYRTKTALCKKWMLYVCSMFVLLLMVMIYYGSSYQ